MFPGLPSNDQVEMNVDSVDVVGPLSPDLGSDYGPTNAVEIQSLKPGKSLETLEETGSLPTNEPTKKKENSREKETAPDYEWNHIFTSGI